MHEDVKAIRRAIKHLNTAWCRRWRDGSIWAGSKRNSQQGMIEVKEALEAKGYRCECNGEPGTSGEYIVEVFLKTKEPDPITAKYAKKAVIDHNGETFKIPRGQSAMLKELSQRFGHHSMFRVGDHGYVIGQCGFAMRRNDFKNFNNDDVTDYEPMRRDRISMLTRLLHAVATFGHPFADEIIETCMDEMRRWAAKAENCPPQDRLIPTREKY